MFHRHQAHSLMSGILADILYRVRSDGHQVFTGFINVIIMEMSLASIHRRNMLLCAEWYVPLPPLFDISTDLHFQLWCTNLRQYSYKTLPQLLETPYTLPQSTNHWYPGRRNWLHRTRQITLESTSMGTVLWQKLG